MSVYSFSPTPASLLPALLLLTLAFAFAFVSSFDIWFACCFVWSLAGYKPSLESLLTLVIYVCSAHS